MPPRRLAAVPRLRPGRGPRPPAVFHAHASNFEDVALQDWWSEEAKASAWASLGSVRDGLDAIGNLRVACNRPVLVGATAPRAEALSAMVANPAAFEADLVAPVAGDPALRRWVLNCGLVSTSGWGVSPNPEYDFIITAGLTALLGGRAVNYAGAMDGIKAHGFVAENNDTFNDPHLHGSDRWQKNDPNPI